MDEGQLDTAARMFVFPENDYPMDPVELWQEFQEWCDKEEIPDHHRLAIWEHVTYYATFEEEETQ